jgi:2',3'-cyclic-nucleotide 2'-phosphodiesterase/3'-nucleotidase
VVFHAPPGTLGLAQEAGVTNLTRLRDNDGSGKGFALYAVDLSQ